MKSVILVALASALLASCGPDRTSRVVYVDQNGREVSGPQYGEPAYSTPVTTTVVQPGPTVIHDHDDNSGSMLMGMAVGHMMANSGNNSGGGYERSKKVKKTVNNVTNNHYVMPAPTMRPSYSRPAPSYTRPTVTSAPSRPAYKPSSIRTSSSMGSRAVRRR